MAQKTTKNPPTFSMVYVGGEPLTLFNFSGKSFSGMPLLKSLFPGFPGEESILCFHYSNTVFQEGDREKIEKDLLPFPY